MEIDSPNATGIISGFGIPTGGTSGQLLQKVNATNYNTQWLDLDTPIYLSLSKGTVQSIPFQVETTVTDWGTYVNNTPSAWNSSTGTWTCPRTGIYDISFAAMLDYVAPTDLNNREFAPIINHTFIGGGGTIYIGNYWALTTSSTRTPMTTARAVVAVNQGDTIRPRIYQNLRDNTAVNIISGRNHFIINQLPGKIIR